MEKKEMLVIFGKLLTYNPKMDNCPGSSPVGYNVDRTSFSGKHPCSKILLVSFTASRDYAKRGEGEK